MKSITLFILGGVSNIEEEAKKPGIEFTMAVVGPLMSLVLAAIFWGVYFLVQNGATGNPFTLPAQGGYKTVGAAILHYLAYVNGLLAIFNILPGFPLDGGRVSEVDHLGSHRQPYQGNQHRGHHRTSIRVGLDSLRHLRDLH